MDYKEAGTHKEIIAKLDYPAPKCQHCQGQMAKYDFQKASKIPYLECAGYKTLIRLRKRRFRCHDCRKISVAETSLVKKNHLIPVILSQKIAQKLIENVTMTSIAQTLAVSTSTVIRKLKEFHFKTYLNHLPEKMSWDEYSFKKGKMSFIAQDFDSLKAIAILDGRTQTTIRNYFLRYPSAVRNRVRVITMDMFSPYYKLARLPSLSHFQAQAETISPQTVSLPNAKIVLDRFHIVQHMSRAMNRLRIQVMNQFDRKSHEYKAFKRYWKLIQQDSRKLSDKRFYHPTFRMHLTNQEIVTKLLDYSEELREHYELYQLLLFHFQERQTEHFFDPIHETLPKVNPIFQTVFRTFLKDKDMIINALELSYSNAKLGATNNLIKVIKRNAFGFRKMITLQEGF